MALSTYAKLGKKQNPNRTAWVLRTTAENRCLGLIHKRTAVRAGFVSITQQHQMGNQMIRVFRHLIGGKVPFTIAWKEKNSALTAASIWLRWTKTIQI